MGTFQTLFSKPFTVHCFSFPKIVFSNLSFNNQSPSHIHICIFYFWKLSVRGRLSDHCHKRGLEASASVNRSSVKSDQRICVAQWTWVAPTPSLLVLPHLKYMLLSHPNFPHPRSFFHPRNVPMELWHVSYGWTRALVEEAMTHSSFLESAWNRAGRSIQELSMGGRVRMEAPEGGLFGVTTLEF